MRSIRSGAELGGGADGAITRIQAGSGGKSTILNIQGDSVSFCSLRRIRVALQLVGRRYFCIPQRHRRTMTQGADAVLRLISGLHVKQSKLGAVMLIPVRGFASSRSVLVLLHSKSPALRHLLPVKIPPSRDGMLMISLILCDSLRL